MYVNDASLFHYSIEQSRRDQNKGVDYTMNKHLILRPVCCWL